MITNTEVAHKASYAHPRTSAAGADESGPAPRRQAGVRGRVGEPLGRDHSPPASLARRAASCSSEASEPPVVSEVPASEADGRADAADSDE